MGSKHERRYVGRDIRRSRSLYRKSLVRNRPLMMEVVEDLPMAREITAKGLELATLPKGRYEVRIQSHPKPEMRGRQTKWVVADCNGHQVGLAKNFIRKSLEPYGVVRFFLLGT